MSSQFTGVVFLKASSKFRAYVTVSGKQLSVGCHQQEQQAAKARDKVLFVLDREDEIQVGLTPEEKQQLQGISLEQLLSAVRAESSKFSKGSSAYRGVSYNKSQRQYCAFVTDQGKNVYLGRFDTEEDAAHAFDKAARRCYGSKALLNFSDAEDLTANDPSTGTVVESLATKNHPAVRSNAPTSPSFRAISPKAPAPKSHAARAPLPKGPLSKTLASSSPAPRPLASSSPAARASADNSPAVKALAHNKPAAKTLAPGALAAHVPTFTRPSGTSCATSAPSASNTAVPVSSAKAVGDLGAASSPAAATGPGASGPMSFPLAEQCSLGHEGEEDQAQGEEDEVEEDTDDELCSDEDLSSWGSDAEIWGSDSDFYDTDNEEEGPMADLLNHPDYKYLVRHNGEPNLSLLGGPDADITPANLLNKLMVKWSEEAEESSECATPGFGACAGDAVIPERWEEAGAAGGSGGATEQGVEGGGRRSSMKSGVKAAGRRGAEERRRRRNNKSLKPNAEAVSMANQGCRAVPGMSPADYREALYSTWMTDRPWGMKLIDCDSDGDDITYSSADKDDTLSQASSRRKQTMSLDEDIPSTDDEEERSEKRVKLTEATQALGEQMAALQKRMGTADGRNAATTQTDKPGSIPWWAQEMGMTEEEYWSSLPSYGSAVAPGTDTIQEAARKVEMSQEDLDFLASYRTTQRRSTLYL